MQTWHWRLVTNRSSKTWSASAKPASMSPAATRLWAATLRSVPSCAPSAPPAIASPGAHTPPTRPRLAGAVHARGRVLGDLDRLDPAQRGLLVDGDDRRHAPGLVADEPVRE